MPIIEFGCNVCGKKFEELILQDREWAEVACPKCASRDIRRLFSVFGMVSKGKTGDLNAHGGSGCTSCARSSCAGCGG
jgi:putative FmdB family regulatory protein